MLASSNEFLSILIFVIQYGTSAFFTNIVINKLEKSFQLSGYAKLGLWVFFLPFIALVGIPFALGVLGYFIML